MYDELESSASLSHSESGYKVAVSTSKHDTQALLSGERCDSDRVPEPYSGASDNVTLHLLLT
jgi:hypothetical protein